eukprot:gene8642-11682_t
MSSRPMDEDIINVTIPSTKNPALVKTERAGLTTEQAEALYETVGFNELPHVEVSLWWIFFIQFTGLMPYMLELACVLALAVQDWIDFAIIAAIVISNGYLGFTEELKAKNSLDELTSKMEQKVAVLRDGIAEHLLTRLLVPGDVILLVGGCSVPADVEWLEGDILSIDTAALTGEPLPRKYPSEEYGNLILCGTTVRAGEAYCIVRKTGINTEVGGSQAEIMKDKTETKISLFEERVLNAVKIIIFISVVDVLIIFLVQGVGRNEFEHNVSELILTCLSIIIAAVPVALPLVLQVTMALGAGKMARDFNAVVTSLPALQDISSMSVLCSDKTGTLTTARITIIADQVWCAEGFTKDDVAFYGALSSNRDKKEDPIDRSVINHFDKVAPKALQDSVAEYTRTRSVGFNPIYKRVLWEYSHATLGTVTIAKGLPAKVIDTADGGEDGAEDQWKVENCKDIKPHAAKVDKDFSKAGYKTLGVAVKINDGPFRFVGILPMLDPPRHDTAKTIKNLKDAGIKVKMITGDHLNIAKETARLIGMGVNIHKGEETRDATQVRNELVWESDGFAQVLPRDKREVVLVLKNIYHLVVGMTGDGVNDAPALSAAQCGIAVDDATDAAKNAAAIILTSPGLSAIYSAVVESRRIFRKLKSYVIYRFAATIQIVVVLTLLIYISNCPINSLYIILLALFNDLTMLPIAYDWQDASASPENPDVYKMLILAALLGSFETCFTLLWAYASDGTGFFSSDFHIGSCGRQAQAGVWVQMSIAAELLIFSARAPSFIFTSIAPSPALFVSVTLGCVIFSIFAGQISFFGKLAAKDIAIIWFYDLICLFLLDTLKVVYLNSIGENIAVLKAPVDDEDLKDEEKPLTAANKDIETGAKISSVDSKDDDETGSRASAAQSRLANWNVATNKFVIGANDEDIIGDQTRTMSTSNIYLGPKKGSSTAIIAAKRSNTSTAGEHRRDLGHSAGLGHTNDVSIVNNTGGGKITVSKNYNLQGSSTDLRRAHMGVGSLRPYTPSSSVLGKR